MPANDSDIVSEFLAESYEISTGSTANLSASKKIPES